MPRNDEKKRMPDNKAQPRPANQELRQATLRHYWQHYNPDYWQQCRQHGFTDQEVLVADLLAAGLKRDEMADRLAIGLSTLGKHINRIYNKLNLQYLPAHAKRHAAITQLKTMGANYKPPI